MKKPISKTDIKLAIDSTKSMLAASKYLNVDYDRFRNYAKLYNLFSPNQPGRNVPRKSKYPLEEILIGKHPKYHGNLLRKRLLRQKILDYKCSICSLNKWLDKEITLELDHIDGNSRNHKIENLRFLCPNCHSQTPTFRNRSR